MKKIVLLLTLFALVLCLAACKDAPEPSASQPSETASDTETEPAATEETTADTQSETESESETETETESETESETETEPGLPVADEADFRPGVWWALGDEIDCYYEICADGTGAVIGQDSGTGVGLNYESVADTVTFHKGAADVTEAAKVTAASADELTLTFDDGRAETWRYQGNVTMNGFTFYSNEELCEMAKAYLQLKEGYTVGSVEAAAVDNDPQTIAIQLYDNLGDHNSTSAWYFVDRFTAKGKDISENPVDLNEAMN